MMIEIYITSQLTNVIIGTLKTCKQEKAYKLKV